MPLSDSFFNDAGGAISSIFGAIGDEDEAGAYSKEAVLAQKNAAITERSTEIQEAQATRGIYQAESSETADVAGAGLKQSGSALDLMRSSVQQGALTKQVIQNQGDITAQGYLEQAQAAKGKEAAAQAAGDSGFLGGLLKGVGAVGSLLGFL